MKHFSINLCYVFCGAETVEANCVFPISSLMNHLREKWFWVRSHVKVLQLKLDSHSCHLNFFVCEPGV